MISLKGDAEPPGQITSVVMDRACSAHQSDSEGSLTFLDLPWEDVLFHNILPCLNIQTIFRLRGINTACRDLIREYFRVQKILTIAGVAGRLTLSAFAILTNESVNLVHLNLRNAKDWLTDSVLIPILKNNPRLRVLDFTNCTTLSNASMLAVAENCPDLRTLVLRECHWLSEEGLTAVALNGRHIQSVDLTGCWNINDQAIVVLAQYCKRLGYISLAKIYGVTDKALRVLALECPHLHHLNVQGCWRISDDSVRILGEYCHSLRALQIRECRDVTELALSRLREKMVKIDVRPVEIYNVRIDMLNQHLRHRLNIQI